MLDESGSMNSMRREAIDAYNQQVEEIREKAKGQQTTVSLVEFNTTVPNPVYWVEPVERMRPITEEDYQPNGMTAMLDAVGLTIDRLKTLPDADAEDTSFLVLILSDGMENNSKKYTYADIAERIQQLDRTDRWTFTYLGANQDLLRVSQQMNIPAANVSAFVADSAGMREGSRKMRTSSGRFLQMRLMGQKSSMDFYTDSDPASPSDSSGSTDPGASGASGASLRPGARSATAISGASSAVCIPAGPCPPGWISRRKGSTMNNTLLKVVAARGAGVFVSSGRKPLEGTPSPATRRWRRRPTPRSA